MAVSKHSLAVQLCVYAATVQGGLILILQKHTKIGPNFANIFCPMNFPLCGSKNKGIPYVAIFATETFQESLAIRESGTNFTMNALVHYAVL